MVKKIFKMIYYNKKGNLNVADVLDEDMESVKKMAERKGYKITTLREY